MPDSRSSHTLRSALYSWAQLVRLPNVFTILADVAAAFLLVAHGSGPRGRFALVLIAGVCLYWAGMILNDVFDREKDKQERSSRPLASGAIGLASARMAAAVLLVLGIVAGFASGRVPSDEYLPTWLPGGIALAIAACVIAYDGPLKRTPLAPALMGGCRVLSFLLGAAPVLMAVPIPGDLAPVDLAPIDLSALVPYYVLAIALGFGTYIMGLTLFGRKEASGQGGQHLQTGTLLAGLGTVMLAFAPQLAKQPQSWHVSTLVAFPVLVGLIAFPVVLRAFRACNAPTPAKIQATMRIGILTIIPLGASFALLGAGPWWAIGIFALVVPSLLLSAKFRVT